MLSWHKGIKIAKYWYQISIASILTGVRNLITLLLIKLICNWKQPKLGFIKYDARTTCLVYFIFFSIDNSEEMLLEKKIVNLVE